MSSKVKFEIEILSNKDVTCKELYALLIKDKRFRCCTVRRVY